MFVLITSFSVHERDIPSRNSSNWSGKTIVHPHLQSSKVEVIKIAVEGRISICSLDVPILIGSESLPEKVSNTAKSNEDQITDRLVSDI